MAVRVRRTQGESVTRADLDCLRAEIRQDTVETKLLDEFPEWAVRFKFKFKAGDALMADCSKPMSSLEERVGDLGRRD